MEAAGRTRARFHSAHGESVTRGSRPRRSAKDATNVRAARPQNGSPDWSLGPIDKLEQLIDDDDARVRLRTAQQILDRALGKANREPSALGCREPLIGLGSRKRHRVRGSPRSPSSPQRRLPSGGVSLKAKQLGP
jgi:hypothetical protein